MTIVSVGLLTWKGNIRTLIASTLNEYPHNVVS